MGDKRRGEAGARIGLSQKITLINSDGLALPAVLKDLSREGFKVAHEGEDLAVGELVTLRTGRSDARAEIIWATKHEAGGRFVDQT